MKLKATVKKYLPLFTFFLLGVILVTLSNVQSKKVMNGMDTFGKAESAAKSGDFEQAYILYIQSSYELEDDHSKAIALYDAAALGWQAEIADYNTLVGLYSQALRYDPDMKEASYNLEYLYRLKENSPEEVPEPSTGKEPMKGVPSNGDV